jgi:TIR domain
VTYPQRFAVKVFISWSGARSKELANALRQWLPMVLQYVEPWVSDKDIAAGERWAQAIAGELNAANFGIICITPENINSEWILFESGALSKSMLDGKVIPLLFGLELSDLSGPLSQFQAQKADEPGITEIIRAINGAAEKPAIQSIVDRLVPTLWPQLLDTLSAIPKLPPSERHKRPSHEILEELVTSVRGLNTRIIEFSPEFIEKDRNIKRRSTRIHPRMVEELSFISNNISDGPTGFLIIAGFIRDEFPWIAEVIVESYREIKDARREDVEQIYNRLRNTIKEMLRHPIVREISGGAKETLMMLDVLPRILDVSFLNSIERSLSRRTQSDRIDS